MKSKLGNFVIFAAGAVLGTAFSNLYFKKMYEERANSEIASVREHFQKTCSKSKAVTQSATTDLDSIIEKSGYARENDTNTVPKPCQHYLDAMHSEDSTEEETYIPSIISPNEFGEKEEYDCISFTYYADGILADDDNCVIDDMKENVGFDWINYFGEYEDDAVFVRNDQKKCYYEILIDSRDYIDVVRMSPKPNEDS